MRRTRTVPLLISIVAVAWACSEGLGPTGGTAPLDVAPSFQLLPSTFDSPPIDRVVLEATDASTAQVVGSADVSVDPAADSWTIPLSIDLGEEPSIDVYVTILLYSGSSVAWSGLEGPITVRAGIGGEARSVAVYRGPLDNLDVVSVTIVDPPNVLTVGETATLSADVALDAGSDASPEVYWASSDTLVATVSPTGSSVTLTAVGAGTVDVIAAAGPTYDEFTLTVSEGVPPGFDVQWEGTTSDWNTPGNWSSGQVPQPTENVYVPASSVDPVLSGSAEVADLTIAPGATVDLFDALLTVAGDLDAGRTITGGGSVVLTGSGTTLRGAIQTQVQVSGTVSTSGTVSMAGALYIDGALGVGAHSVTVGDVTVNGTLSVAQGGTVGSSGTLTLAQGSTLNVDGTVTASACVNDGATITGSGTHPCDGGGSSAGTKAWVGGDVAGPSDWNNANNWNPPGEPGANDTVVVTVGVSYYPAMSTDDTIAAITVESLATVDIGGGDLFIAGDVDVGVGGGLVNGFTIVTGPGSLLQGTFDNLDVRADRAVSGQVLVSGNLSLPDARFDAAGQSVSVSGDLNVSGAAGALVMNTPTDQPVTVFGDAYFNGGDETGLLTEGTLQIGGDLTATGASPGSFVASGNHLLYLFGSSTQSIQFQIPGPTAQRANHVTITSVAGALFQSNVTFSGNFVLFGAASVPSADSVNVGGDLTLQSGSVLQLDGAMNVSGQCTADGIVFGTGTPPCGTVTQVDRVWVSGDSLSPGDWQTPGNWLPSGVPSGSDRVLVPYATTPPTLSADGQVGTLTVALSGSVDQNGHTLTVNGDAIVDGTVGGGLMIIAGAASIQGYFDDLQIDAAVTLSDVTYVFGNLDVRAPVTVGPLSLYAGLALTVQGTGVITMDDPSSQLFVDGNATFDGASSAGQLTGGVMVFYGDVSVFSTNSATSFQATGTATYFYGSADQVVGFDNPGSSGQFLGDVYIYQGQGAALVFNTDVTATGVVYAANAILRQGGRSTFEVTGELDLTSVTLDGLPLRVDSPVSPELHTMADITFTGAYLGSDTQLYLSLAGADVNAPFRLTSPMFETAPSTGYYIDVVNRGGADVPILAVEVTSPTPTGPLDPVRVDQYSVILWP